MNMLTVLDYAVNVLKVKHVIVCGHYGCGGVLAAMSNKQFGLIDNWLRNIKDVYRLHQEELDAIKDDEKRGRRYVELNVIEQVYDLGKTSIIQNSWKTRQAPTIHGWVYDLGTGLVHDLNVNVSDNTNLAEVYQVDI
jgi:carbonic anhydrase